MTKWSKKYERLYEDLCLSDDYDEEACYNFVLRVDDSEFDYGKEEWEEEGEKG
jgi:hypothetical protein